MPGLLRELHGIDCRARRSKICTELTSMLLDERSQVAGRTRRREQRCPDASRWRTPSSNLDDLDTKLAAFKKQYMGQLPGDEENNLKILMGLNSQLDANTQTLNRAQQDKSYTESVLAQQLAAWKSSQSSTNPADAAETVVRLAVAAAESAGSLYRRPSGCDQDQG